VKDSHPTRQREAPARPLPAAIAALGREQTRSGQTALGVATPASSTFGHVCQGSNSGNPREIRRFCRARGSVF
jgi:hypothetical protein